MAYEAGVPGFRVLRIKQVHAPDGFARFHVQKDFPVLNLALMFRRVVSENRMFDMRCMNVGVIGL